MNDRKERLNELNTIAGDTIKGDYIMDFDIKFAPDLKIPIGPILETLIYEKMNQCIVDIEKILSGRIKIQYSTHVLSEHNSADLSNGFKISCAYKLNEYTNNKHIVQSFLN